MTDKSYAGLVRLKKIYVEITNRCNLRCSFCAVSSRPPMTMDPTAFATILGRIQGHTRHLTFHVLGEPLLHPNFEHLLRLCHNHKLRVNLTTNGTLVRPHQQALLTAPALRQINVSLQSLIELDRDTAQMHLLEIIALAKKASRETQRFISLRLWNLHTLAPSQLDTTQQCLLEHLATAFAQAPFDADTFNSGRGILLTERVFLNPAPRFSWPHPALPELGPYGHCRGLRDHLAILVDGTVVPCCLDSEGRLGLGNILIQTLDEILKNPRATQMREGFGHQWLVESLCRRCSYRQRFGSPSPR